MLRRPPVLDVWWSAPPGTPPSVPVRETGPALLAGLVVGLLVYVGLTHLLGVAWGDMLRHPVWFFTTIPLVTWKTMLTAVAGIAAAVSVFLLCWRPRSAERHLCGPRLVTGPQAVREARRLGHRAKPDDLLLHPALRLPEWTRHVLISGSVGSGKTQILMPLAHQLAKRKIPALVLDTKGDYTSNFPGALILSPWDCRSAYWDIAADIRTKEQASAFADALIPVTEGTGKHFDLACRQILTGVLIAMQKGMGTDWGWWSLSEVLKRGATGLCSLLEEHYLQACDLIRDPRSQTTSSTMASLASHCRVIHDLATAWGDGDVPGRKGKMERFSLAGWRHGPHRMVCLHVGLDQSLSRAYLAAFFATASGMLLRLPDSSTRRVFLLLDELTAIGKIDLEGLFERGRSKGVSVVAGFQDLAQVRAVYGRDFAEALSSMVGTQVICQIGPGETRERVAEWCGSERIAIPTITHSHHGGDKQHGVSAGVHEENRKLVLPAELTTELGVRHQGKNFTIRSLLLAGGDLLVLDWPGIKWRAKRRPHVTAKWCLVSREKEPPAPDS